MATLVSGVPGETLAWTCNDRKPIDIHSDPVVVLDAGLVWVTSRKG